MHLLQRSFKYNFIYTILFILACTFSGTHAHEHTITLDTLYGTFTITEPVIIELLEHPMMQRLKNIHQYGLDYYAIQAKEYHRYEHSVGVFVLLRRYGAPLKEQIAGLLHDVSHTVFSHVGDWIFGQGDAEGDSYQDDHHAQFLYESGIEKVLQKHGFSIQDVHHKTEHFTMLEQSLPDICADRLEYNLKGGLIEGLITQNDIQEILYDLHFEEDRWFFTQASTARKLALCPLYMTEHVWTCPEALMINTWAGNMFKNALTKGIVTPQELHFSVDDAVWQKICSCNSTEIQDSLQKILNHKKLIRFTHPGDHDVWLHAKFRGINPWIKQGNTFVRLTELDADFKCAFERVKEVMRKGWHIKLSS